MSRLVKTKNKKDELAGDAYRAIALLESVLEDAGVLHQKSDQWDMHHTVSDIRTQKQKSGASQEEIIKRIDKLEKMFARYLQFTSNPERTITTCEDEVQPRKSLRLISPPRGLIDVLVQKTYKNDRAVVKIIVEEIDGCIIYHIFVAEGCLGEVIQDLMKKSLDIQDFFENGPIDFRIHDIRAEADLVLDDSDVLCFREEVLLDDCSEVNQI